MAPSRTNDPLVYRPITLPPRRVLDRGAPLDWLAAGWQYFNRNAAVSIAYGAMFAAIGMLITWLGLDRPQFILTFWTGFLLVGPLLALGLYRIAQLDDRGEHTSLTACGGGCAIGSVALFTLLLSLAMIAWIRLSTIAAALYIANIAGSSGFVAALATPEGFGFLLVLFGTGAVFAAMMFALTAWSLPLVLDGRTDFGRAVLTSVRATLEQPKPMLTWGAIVAGLTAFGMITFLQPSW